MSTECSVITEHDDGYYIMHAVLFVFISFVCTLSWLCDNAVVVIL